MESSGPLSTSEDVPSVVTRPTVVRHLVVFVAFVASVILYLDRFCVAFADNYIREDLGLTPDQMTWIQSAFFWSYALAQVPSGWMSDRFGARGIYTVYIILWSVFTGLIGMAHGFVFLVVMRLGCGLWQAGAYPTSASLLGRWVPVNRRGTASSLVGLGGRLGGAIAQVLTGYLILTFVPAGASPLLDKSSLLNGQSLIEKLMPDQLRELSETTNTVTKPVARSAVAERVWQRLPVDVRDQLSNPSGSIDFDLLLRGLNEVLRQPGLYDEQTFRRSQPEREAIKTLERQQAGETLSDGETLRLNRLLLEAAFRDEIGKLYTRGWRPVLIVYGLAGVVVAGLFWISFRDRPHEHPLCNRPEIDLIEAGRVPQDSIVKSLHQPFPWRAILRSRTLWADSTVQFTTNVSWIFLVTLLPRYLIEVHRVPIVPRAWMASIPALLGIAGMLLGGRLTDWMVSRFGLKWGRMIPICLTKFGAAGAYLVCVWLDAPWPATIALSLAYFFTDLGVAGIWAIKQDIGGQYIGSILGWGNMWGNLGAAIAPPLLYSKLLGKNPTVTEWNHVFLLCAGSFVLAGVAALWIDASRRVE